MLIQTYAKYLVVISFILVFFGVCERARALTVSPVKAELSGDPGQTINGEMTLFNEQKEDKEPKTFYSSFANFEARGETGTPHFTSATEGLSMWIETVKQVILKPGEQKTAPFSIMIPEDADPGGYFAAIFWSTTPPGETGGEEQVSVSGRLGVLILLAVGGEVKEGGGILEFSAGNEQKLFNSLPINFAFRFQNSGNDRVKPAGEITIKNIFGKVSAVLPVNKSEGNVLPRSIRKFEVIWEKLQEDEESEKTNKIEKDTEKKGFFEELKNEKDNFAFGRYTAELNLKYGGEKSQASFSFFIIPWRILTLTIIFLILAILIIAKGVKKYNQRVVAKAVKALEEAKAMETKEAEKKVAKTKKI